MDVRFDRRGAGFTLVELLVVIAIIAILGTLSLTMFQGARQDSEDFQARSFVSSIQAKLTLYKNDRAIGVYPPTSLESFQGLGRLANRTNMGIEAMTVCLNSSGFKSEKLFDAYEDDMFVNEDDDFSAKPLTAFGTNDLFEIVDPWGNPYAYFNALDYGDTKLRQYLVASGPNEDFEIVTVKPWTNPKTKSFYNSDSYQLFSAGPDMRFNTEDDIGNW